MLLGAIFVASGILKIPSLTSFELYVFSFGLASFDMCSIAARLLLVFEVTLGLWIFCGVARKWSNLCCAAVLVAFTIFIISRLAIGDNSSCHCFGELVDMKPGVSVIKNAVLGAMLVFCWKTGFSQSFSFLYILLAAVVLGIAVFATNPMDSHFRSRGADSNISSTLWEEFASEREFRGRHIVAFYSTGCKFCANCISKVSGMVRHNDIAPETVYNVFLASDGFELRSVSDFYETYGNSLNSRFEPLDADTFLNLTNGVMPVVLLVEDGVIYKEYNYITLDEQEVVAFLKPPGLSLPL